MIIIRLLSAKALIQLISTMLMKRDFEWELDGTNGSLLEMLLNKPT